MTVLRKIIALNPFFKEQVSIFFNLTCIRSPVLFLILCAFLLNFFLQFQVFLQFATDLDYTKSEKLTDYISGCYFLCDLWDYSKSEIIK